MSRSANSAVADVVDLARPEVDHRPDALGRQRRLAQPVHLAMDLPAQRGGHLGGRPGDDRPPPDRDDHDQDQQDQPHRQQGPSAPRLFRKRRAARVDQADQRPGPDAMHRVGARDAVGDQREDPRVIVQDEVAIRPRRCGASQSATCSAGDRPGRGNPRLAPRGDQRHEQAHDRQQRHDQQRLDGARGSARSPDRAGSPGGDRARRYAMACMDDDPLGEGSARSGARRSGLENGERVVRSASRSSWSLAPSPLAPALPATAGRGSREDRAGQARSRSSNRRNANNNAAPLYNTQ